MASNTETNGPGAGTDAPVSLRVIDALAAAERIDPTELDRPLYRTVDPEALDRLFESAVDGTLNVSFDYEGHSVTVRDDGVVTVDGAERPNPGGR